MRRTVIGCALGCWISMSAACTRAEDDFQRPTAVAFAPNGHAYVTDGYDNAHVVEFDERGCLLGSFGEHGVGPGQFETPHGIAIAADGTLFVADRENARVQVFSPDGHFLHSWFGPEIGHPWALALDAQDHLFVADGGNQTPGGTPRHVTELDRDGRILGVLGQDAALGAPHGIALGSDGSVYVADLDGRALRKFVRQ